ncbi:hypothetical protein [Puia dinghuensis]|uniref:Uncharacterized protein n=1 Tax=Puia dinghuensis TaxID=1792502 RepID=A0A8J2UBN6_9BACT|nr:hypothetical protein [Puia dinghuensis]GGA94946.1 hypothetical protein GCM10011511_17830 [Puia dinghuensis]
MKKPGNTFKKKAKHVGRKAKGEVISYRPKKKLPRDHPFSEADLSPQR